MTTRRPHGDDILVAGRELHGLLQSGPCETAGAPSGAVWRDDREDGALLTHDEEQLLRFALAHEVRGQVNAQSPPGGRQGDGSLPGERPRRGAAGRRGPGRLREDACQQLVVWDVLPEIRAQSHTSCQLTQIFIHITNKSLIITTTATLKMFDSGSGFCT